MNVRRIVNDFRAAAILAVGAAAMALLPTGSALAQDKPIKVGLTAEVDQSRVAT